AGQDDERHADREDDEERVVDEQVRQHAGGQEVVVAGTTDRDDQGEHHEGPDDGHVAPVDAQATSDGPPPRGLLPLPGRPRRSGRGVFGGDGGHQAATSSGRAARCRARAANFSRMRGDCRSVTAITTSALNSGVTSGEMPTIVTVRVRVVMIRTPTSVPESENLPPCSDVPPMTTARIASSSMNRPALLASAAITLDARMRPARPEKRPESAKTVHTIVRALTPASRLAAGLMPTDSTSMPSAVRRVRSATRRNTPPATSVATGRPSQKPEPSVLKGALVTVVICPSVMSMRMPRPAVMRLSVAMIGWMPTTETRNPFQTPSTRETPSAIAIARSTVDADPGSGDVAMKLSESAPEMATTAPT